MHNCAKIIRSFNKVRKQLFFCLLVILVFLLLFNCSTDYTDDDTEEIQYVKILYIGNSYTYFNDLPKIIKDIAITVNIDITYDQSTFGGYRFLHHKDDAATISKIQAEDWDYVVLQNQSQRPGFKPDDVRSDSLPHAEALVDLIKANNSQTEIIYFQTWGRENGDSQNAAYYSLVSTFDGHTQALKEGYEIYQESTGGEIAPVGSVWQQVVNDGSRPFNRSDLWIEDESHPELLGSYLAALTILSQIMDVNPRNISENAGLSAGNASYLRSVTAEYFGYYGAELVSDCDCVQTTPSGTTRFEKLFWQDGETYMGEEIISIPQNKLLITGIKYLNNDTINAIVLTQTNKYGDEIWTKTIDTLPNHINAYDMIMTGDYGVILLGRIIYTNAFPSGGSIAFAIKSSSSETIATCIAQLIRRRTAKTNIIIFFKLHIVYFLYYYFE